ncbi:CIA30 family protein [Rhodohalobacter sp. 8-1]|uniref:CIA30 family protein n=1 Tax=Rhodohalobacter sp. 8-1 TaxID=3131972 RepID=UPI0030EEA0F4
MNIPDTRLITDFTNLAAQKWMITNDGVMGGNSSSQFQINKDGNGVFIGTISLENNGGFASVKNHEPINLSGFSFIRLSVKGDGNRYSFRLQTGSNGQVNPWSYEHRFETKDNEWTEIDLPLNKFVPTYRGSTPDDAPPLDPSDIKRYGFLISDDQEGDFRLEIEQILAF